MPETKRLEPVACPYCTESDTRYKAWYLLVEHCVDAHPHEDPETLSQMYQTLKSKTWLRYPS